jgi:hypothetical protein
MFLPWTRFRLLIKFLFQLCFLIRNLIYASAWLNNYFVLGLYFILVVRLFQALVFALFFAKFCYLIIFVW